jgi:hypothetical protein
MQKSFLLLALLVTSFVVSAQNKVNLSWITKLDNNDEYVIHYRAGKKLVWDDFLGAPNLPEPFAALTSNKFGYTAKYRSKNDVTTFDIAIYCYFIKGSSWVKNGMRKPEILAHEQLHFDICYFFTKQFYDGVSKLNLQPKTMSDQINAIYKSCATELEAMQQAYDNETNHGIIKDKQQQWSDRVKNMLK